PVAGPRPQGAQRDGRLVAPPRRLREALNDALVVVASQRAFFGFSTLLFAAGVTGTILWCASMSEKGEMSMPGDWTMSMAWMRMTGQTWPGAAASFLGMWIVMMVAMMLPSLVPMLWRYRQAVGRTGGRRLGRLSALVGMGGFSGGAMFGVAACPLGAALAAVAMRLPTLARAVPIAVGMVVLIAGALQVSAWKAHHLDCCRKAPTRGRCRQTPGRPGDTACASASTVVT